MAIVSALASAASVVAFMWCIGHLFDLLYVGAARRLSLAYFALVSFAGITVAALVSGWLMHRFCPEAAGSGIPQLKVAFWKDLGFMKWRAVWAKFLAGVVSIGGGMSLGREGPCVYIGAGTASVLSGFLGVSKRNRRAAAIGGAAAGLAAAFNTPLAAVAFAMEEILSDLGSRLLGGVILAAVVGALVTHALLGAQPAFLLPPIGEPRWEVYLFVPMVAIVASYVAVAFQSATLRLRAHAASSTARPWLRPLAGAWITWVLGIGVFALTGQLGVFGLGYGVLSDAMSFGIGAGVALLLLGAKWMATVSSYGFGGCGGIFSPTLFLGAMTGFGLGSVFDPWLTLTQHEHILLACVGMVACFGGTVRAPWSALLIVFEMTHEFSLVPALLLTTFISQVIVRRYGKVNFYDGILLQDGHRMPAFAPPRRMADWGNTPVLDVATLTPVFATDLSQQAMERLLSEHPYKIFPVLEAGVLSGMAKRESFERAVQSGARPEILPAPTVASTATVQQAGVKLVESDIGMVLIMQEDKPEPIALLTLQDMLRAEILSHE